MESKKVIWMIRKDLKVLWRNKVRLLSIIMLPIIMIIFFGYGMGGELDNIPIVVVKQSNGPITDATLNAIKETSLYEIKDIITDPDKGKEMVQNGHAKAVLILPPNYENTDHTIKNVILYADSSDQIARSALVTATQTLFNEISNEIGVKELNIMNIQTSTFQPNSAQISNSSVQTPIASSINFGNIVNSINLGINDLYGKIDYMDFLMPAVLAMTIMFTCMYGMGEAIAGERERGELARLFMTPTSVATVIIGKIISKLFIYMGQSIILLVTAIILFNIVINGSIALTLLLLALTVLCFVGMGMMVSARVPTQEDYMQLVLPLTLPMMFVSGVYYPLDTMPWIFQKIAYLIPLTYANDALRTVMLKGGSIGDIWIDVVILLGFTLLFFAVGVKKFNRDI